MDQLPFLKKIGLHAQGYLNAFLYATTYHRLLGFTLAGWLKFLPLILGLAAWLQGWPVFWLAAGVLLSVLFRLLYWWAKRQGYISFIPEEARPAPAEPQALADNTRVVVKATGLFSVSHREAYILQRPAEYWRVPIGDHVIMVQERPGRFLYQFVQMGALQRVEPGYLVFGPQPQKALAITFLTTWGPKSADDQDSSLAPSENGHESKLQRIIYLSFEDEETRGAVWHNLLRARVHPPANA
ncbi:MAG: hypothetical protein L0332_21470 [Chloroflexi bacterium]|nr:hypothetical protein [Chloroflexota bacterium]MCI0577996.1 hypothetical protein [Chloroflexota bacterium]MCI0646975.1 hypothetical protein [Chloroflexota bacterium]MCI0729266.1 hypothetical protein [Chloroflexota bacterium]